MEVDERLRWLEARISSSLRPRGEELRSLFSDEENRAAFLAFCNHSEARRLFVYLPSSYASDQGEGQICVTATPPKQLSDKALIFLKCGHASKLNRESIGHDVVYSECSKIPLEHLELVMREVYLPLMSVQTNTQYGVSGEKLLDLIHRMVGVIQVTRGFSEGQVVLPLPSIEVLAEAATNTDRRSTVVHVLESSVVSWMKQVKMAMYLEPNSSIIKEHGKYAGPLAEVEFWTRRLSRLEFVRGQLNSVIVLNILHNLEQAHSTYATAFIHVHKDIGKAIVDTEHCLMYLNTLQPWFARLHNSFSPETLIQLFPSLMTTLLLVWQHSGFYSDGAHFHRVLRLLSNQVMLKAKDIVGEDILQDPELSLQNLKLALRVCAAFRGCYLDYREKSERIRMEQQAGWNGEQDNVSSQLLHSTTSTRATIGSFSLSGHGGVRSFDPSGHATFSTGHRTGLPGQTGGPVGHSSSRSLCSWPPRNSPVFALLNAIMERCNDLLELVQTVHEFRELEAIGNDEAVMTQSDDPLVVDIYTDFSTCMRNYQNETKDLLNIEMDCSFEEHFFHFRTTVKSLEQRLIGVLARALDDAPSLPAQLRVLELFQGICRREQIKIGLQHQLEKIVAQLLSEVISVSETLSTNHAHPPSYPHTPPVACKLLWLYALKERVSQPMNKVRLIAPHLLEGEEGWKLRHTFSGVISDIDNHFSQTESTWCQSVRLGLNKKLKENILTQNSVDGSLSVNLDPELCEVLSEARYLSRPPLSVRLPTALRHMVKSVGSMELKHRYTCLQVVIQTYNELHDGLTEVERMLFQHKLHQIDKLLSTGLDELDWTSSSFHDFVAKARAAICNDLQPALDQVRQYSVAIHTITQSWIKIRGLDIFQADETEGKKRELSVLVENHKILLETIQSCLRPSLKRITTNIDQSFLSINEASQESPAWMAYLSHIDTIVLIGLKNMILATIATLIQRATQYEQGDPIPPLVMVRLELQGSDVQFFPPLSGHCAISSVSEVVQQWMNDYIELARLVPRFGGGSTPEGGSTRTCYEAISTDSEIRNAISKISAHLETNSRQCQSLRKRFSIYSFLWEQDVGSTFAEFMRGQAPPHPRRFTRPETVRSRASARAHSAKSSSQSQVIQPPEPSLLGVMGVSDWDFLCPPSEMRGVSSEEEEDTSHRPSLDDFDGEIAVFQGILIRLSRIESVANVGWVCVDQRPAKEALSSFASKWKHVYASHLEKQISYVLSRLEVFFKEIEPEVEAISGEESDTQAFMKLMSIFNRVNTQQLEMDTKFGALHRAVLMLDKFEHSLPAVLREQFNNAPQRWGNLKKRVALGKQRIGPRIQAKGDIIFQDLSRFGEIFANLKHQFNSSQCLQHDCKKETAMSTIGRFNKELKGLQTQARDLIELQELLETSIFNFSLLKEFEEELSVLQEVWSISDSILSQHAKWYSHHWDELDHSDLILGVEQQLDLVSSLPVNVAKEWDIYQYTLDAVYTIQTSTPMVEWLRSPAMRPRHWKQVIRHASGGTAHLLGRGGTFDPLLLEELTFGQLMEMRLHTHLHEVQSIVERANKDVAIESLLNTFEEVWLSKLVELKHHVRVTDASRQETVSELGIESATPKAQGPIPRVTSAVRRSRRTSHSVGGHTSMLSSTSGREYVHKSLVPLLCNTGSIFETLESHQISLQSLQGTIAAASFADDLQKWRKQLQTIEAVLLTWLKVQSLWVQLEEVYASSEVQQHLPNHAFTFGNVDQEWRELMLATAKNPAVMNVCLKEGLLPSLEKLLSGLQQCQAALVKYVEEQRIKCPWFYMLPLEDILQFVCYGSNLQQFSIYISKLFPHAGSLQFDSTAFPLSPSRSPYPTHAIPSGGGGATRVTGIVSLFGEKTIFTQGVLCDGPIESIITQLMSTLRSTLHTQLTNTITKYITLNTPHHHSPVHPYPMLLNLPKIWNSTSLSTQIVILSSQIALEMSLTKALQEAARVDSKQILEEFVKEIDNLSGIVGRMLKGSTEDDDTSSVNLPTPSAPLTTDSQAPLDSNVALKASTSIFAEGSASDLEEQLKSDMKQQQQFQLKTRDQISRLQNVLLVLANYRYKSEELSQHFSNGDILKSFSWQSMLHFEWSSRSQTSTISSLDASVKYGFHYTGNAGRIVLTPQLEKSMHYLLQTLKQGSSSLVTGNEGIGKGALIHELAVCTGQPLYSLHCSAQMMESVIPNTIRGMALTGCWLYFESINNLQPALLQTVCIMITLIQQARLSHSETFQWMGEKIRLSTDPVGVCFASITTPPSIANTPELSSHLPPTILDAFKTCSVQVPERKLILKALFLAQGFESATFLAESLETACKAVEELLNTDFVATLAKDLENGSIQTVKQMSIFHLKKIVALAQKHMLEYSALLDPQIQTTSLKMPSVVYSEFSESTRASLKFRTPAVSDDLEGKNSQQMAYQRQSLEEFALILALKDTLLPSLPLNGKEYSVIVRLLNDLFPSCDLQGLLDHEANVREGMAIKAKEDREAVESVRESRAASAMQMVQEDSEIIQDESTLEQVIVQTCHLKELIPTPQFQSVVSEIVTLVQLHQFTVVYGPSSCGKTSAIQVAAETVRHNMMMSSHQTGHFSLTTIAVGAMEEEQLLGYQKEEESCWQDGLLVQLLGSSSSQDSLLRPATQWFVLEGNLSPSQLEALVTFATGTELTLTLDNGKTLQLDQSVKFIFEMPDLDSLTPVSATKVAKQYISATTITWRDVALKWIYKQPRERAGKFHSLFEKYIPSTFQFIAPALKQSCGDTVDGEVSTVSVSDSPLLEGQNLQLSEIHVINMCCLIFETLLSNTDSTNSDSFSDNDLERLFIYSVVWSFGGFLNSHNKSEFDSWWRKTFNHDRPDFCFPKDGTIWDYHVVPGCQTLVSWKDTLPRFVLPSDKSSLSFVPTVRSAGMSYLIETLINRGVPVLLDGASGSGKTSLVLDSLSGNIAMSEMSLLHIYSNHFTSAQVVWNQLKDCLEWDWGKKYTPKGKTKLVCFIDDLHNTESLSACELVRQHLSSGHVCEPTSAKWHDISDVSYIITTDSNSRVQLKDHFLKHFVVLHWKNYCSDEMIQIFSTVLKAQFSQGNTQQSPSDLATISSLVETVVQVHRRLSTMFLTNSERLHYLFSMKHIAAVFRQLLVGCDDTCESHDFLLPWQQESWWTYGGVLSSKVDRERYWEVVCHALRKYFNEDSMLPQLLSDRSVHLSEKRIDELRSKLLHELAEYNMTHPTVHINLYKCTIEEISYLSRVINSRDDFNHMLLLGYTHPEPLVLLAAIHNGYTVVQPSQYFSQTLLQATNPFGMSTHSYGVTQLRKNLISIYTSAGVKNEKLLLLLTDKELLNESFLTCVYEFVKAGAISALFSPEEASRIVNAVRSDVTQAGLEFSKEVAWNFFLNRVRSNLRVVLSLYRLRETMVSGCQQWNELLGTMRVYTHIPWERKQLIDVASHHLQSCDYLLSGQSESLAHSLASIHLILRARDDMNISNATFEYFVEWFVHELAEIYSASQSKCSQLSTALKCVDKATEKINCLQDKIKRETVVLEEKSIACTKLLVQIGQDTAISRQLNKLLSKQTNRITHLQKVIPDFEHAFELAVKEKEDIVDKSQQLVLSMDHQSLTELRALQRAPHEIEELLVAVITIIKGPSADFSWTKGAKRLMANLDRFRELLLEYSAREDNSDILLEALDPLIEKPTFSAEHFLKHPGGKVASQLSYWVKLVHSLHSTLQTKTRPLESKLATMKASLSEYTDKLKQQEGKVLVLEERLEGLSFALESASVEKSRQQELVNSMNKELRETQDFVQSLSGVYEHWSGELNTNSAIITNTVGALCLCASITVYLGPLTPHVQMEVINSQLVPVLEERGIELCWKSINQFATAITSFSSSSSNNDTQDDDGGSTSEVNTADEDSNQNEAQCVPYAKDCSKSQLNSSYASLCSCVASLLVKESFSEQWLAQCCSLPHLLPCSLVHSMWNRWPLVYDPQGFATQWLTQYNEKLIRLDATDRSSKFYLSLEQALVNGEAILIENFPSPFDPALQPLIELGHSWKNKDSSRVIQFCGHRLHVHSSFQLYLTTTTDPTLLSPSLLDQVAVINFDSSLPLTQDLLAHVVCDEMVDGGVSKVRRVCEEIVLCKSRLREIEEELFKKLPKEGREDTYWLCTEKITQIVTEKNEVEKKLSDLMADLKQSCTLQTSLLPIAKHGALLYAFMKQLGVSTPCYLQSWQEFVSIFKAGLTGYTKQHTNSNLKVDGTTHDNSELITGVIQNLNKTFLQDSFRVLDYHSWQLLASSIALLSQCDLSQYNHLLLVEQVLYLLQGNRYIQDLNISEEPPPASPSSVPHHFWHSLHKVPLSVEYFSKVVKSIHDDTEYWEKMTKAHLEKEEGKGDSEEELVVLDLSMFPWQAEKSHCLDDYVLLMCINSKVAQEKLLLLVSPLMESVSVPLLSDVLKQESGSTTATPLLLVHNESCPTSQSNMLQLESELRAIHQENGIHVVILGSGVEDTLSDLLSQPKHNCMLVVGLEHATPQWLELLTWRTRQAMASGCSVVFTASFPCSNLPKDFIQLCYTASLSCLATTLTKNLPREAWFRESLNFHLLLQFHLNSITAFQLDSLHVRWRPLVFNLAVLHTAVALVNEVSPHVISSHVSTFLSCISTLTSLIKHNDGPEEFGNVLNALVLYVRNIYSNCVTTSQLSRLIDACLTKENVSPGVQLHIPDIETELTVPSEDVTPKLFVEHVKGLCESKELVSHLTYTHISETIEALFLPVLVQIHSPDLYNPSPPSPASPSIPHTPAKSRESKQNRAIIETLEYCMEQLPGAFSLEVNVSESALERLTEGMNTCSQLVSRANYQAYCKSKVISQFNSTLHIITTDISTLTHYANIGFDGLPIALVPVLASLERNEMPLKWTLSHNLLLSKKAMTLTEGLQELQRLHAQNFTSV